jgi:alkaline phosphatase D
MLRRRDFLRATVFTAGALLVPGCGDETTPTPTPTPERKLEDGTANFPQSVASGDPRSDSVILWARVDDPDQATADLDLEIEIATDEAFTSKISLGAGQAKVKALSKYDHCAKVKITGLTAATTYHYRFIYTKGEKNLVSHVGRTRTAAAADSDVPVKFAFVSCQDFIGRYYNTHIALAQEELDFFVHLGDYIYETTGDPSFQTSKPDRAITFTDEAGALALSDGKTTYYAAKSLDNYRQLYRSIRGDKNLQKVHERFAMIATWDDHEFSNDCYGDTATYFNDEKDEKDPARRKAANQAWFEYQPVDYLGAPDFAYDPAAAVPEDIKIWRDFSFGKHVHLVMTDLRAHRVDGLVPEDALPGAVAVEQAALMAELGSLPALATPYVDVATYQAGIFKTALVAVAAVAGYDPAKITGKISVAFINGVGAKVNPSLPPAEQIPTIDATLPTLEKGYSFADLGKNSYYSSIGTRYLAVKDTFETFATIAYKASKASQEVMGPAQEAWFLSTIQGSKATWKVWGNEYPLSQIAIDLSPFPLPDAFKRSFMMDLDSWDGFRDKRSELVGKLADVGGVVAVTGDIHAFFAGTPATSDGKKKIVEFVGGAVSSGTYVDLLLGTVQTDPVLSTVAGADILAKEIDTLLTAKDTKTNPYLGYTNCTSHGYVVVEAGPKEFVATMHLIPGNQAGNDFTGQEASLAKFIKQLSFKTLAGESELYQQIDGAWKKWDPTKLEWV